MNPLQEIFETEVRCAADRLAKAAGFVALGQAPDKMQARYLQQAREELRYYLATCGIV